LKDIAGFVNLIKSQSKWNISVYFLKR